MRIIAALTLALTVAGAVNPPEASSQRSRDQVVLRVALWAGAQELLMEQRIVDEFMRQNPEVRVQIESIPSNYKEKILTSMAAGRVADVILLDSPIIPSLLNRNALVDLRPYAEEADLNLDDYFDPIIATYTRGDSLLAFPKGFTPLVMYYNRRLFDEAGIPYPDPDWTWDDYLEMSHRLTLDTTGDGHVDQFGTVFLTDPYLWQPWVWINNGDIVSPDAIRASGYFDSVETKEALQFLMDLRTRHFVAPHNLQTIAGSFASAAMALFYNNRVAMVSSGHWALLGMRDYMDRGQLDIGVVRLPVPPEGHRTTVLYGAGWSVTRQTRHPEWAIRLAAFLGGEWAAGVRAASDIEIPAVERVAREKAEADPTGMLQVFLDEVPYGRQSWGTRIDDFPRLEHLAQRAIEEVMIGGRDIDRTFAEAAEEMDEVLAVVQVHGDEVVRLTGNREILLFLLLTAILLVGAALVGVLVVSKGHRRNLLTGYKFLAPSFAILLVFQFTPVFFALYLSFHDWNVVNPAKPFVGLDNFVRLFHDYRFWRSFWNTAVYTLHVPVGMVFALIFAVLMNQKIVGVKILRALYFLPSISSFVAIALVWKWLYHPQFGLFNYALGMVGLPPYDWLADPSMALLAVMVLSVWMAVGYQMIIFLAGLQGIPGELYEAAKVDGANALRRFWYITLPMLRPTTFFILVTSMISSFQVFSLIYVMTQGGPIGSTDVVVFHIYQNAWEYLRMGYASAMSWVLFIVIVIATWIQFRFMGRNVSYN